MNTVVVARNPEQVLQGRLQEQFQQLVAERGRVGGRCFLMTEKSAGSVSEKLINGFQWVQVEPPAPEGKEMFLSQPHLYSYQVLRTLRRLAQEHSLDAIHFCGEEPEGFATIRARRLLHEFPDTHLVVHCETPRSLRFQTRLPASLFATTICDVELEDYSLRHADFVLAGNSETVEFLKKKGGRAELSLWTGNQQSLPELLHGRAAPRKVWHHESGKKVSVVIPLFNQGRYLRETIASVRASSYANLEIVVVNDGSTDPDTIKIFEAVSEVVKVNKKNGGLGSARNAGIRAATGDYLLMLDADDKIHPDYISTAVNALENNDGLGYVACHVRCFGALDYCWIPIGFVPALMPFMNTSGACANVFRREVFQSAMYDETLSSVQDWDLVLTLHSLGFEGDVLPHEFFFYRRHFDSMIFTVTQPRRAELVQTLMSRHPELVEAHARTIALVLAHLWKTEEMRAEAQNPKSDQAQCHLNELKSYRELLNEYGLLSGNERAPRLVERALFRALSCKMRRSLRKRMASFSRWLLDTAATDKSIMAKNS